MWILQIFKDTLNASFDYFMEKIKGRFWAFLVQLVLSYLAVAILTLMITVTIISLLNSGEFTLDLFSAQGLFEWVRMIDPVWMVTVVIGVNFLFNTDPLNKRMSFPDFFEGKSTQFWLDLVLAVAVLAVVFTIYYKNELMLSFDRPPLEVLLSEGFGDFKSPLETLLSNWIYYTVMALPIIAVIVIEIRERKRNGFSLKIALWKVMMALVLLIFILTWTFESLLFVFGELVLNIIYAPFEMIEIPAVFGGIAAIVSKTVFFFTASAFFHFTLQLNMERVTTEVIDNTTNELLDT